MKRNAVHLTILQAGLASFAIACGVGQSGDTGQGRDNELASHGDGPTSSNGNGGVVNVGSSPDGVPWCSTTLNRTGTIDGTSLDYPSKPDTTWFNTSLEEIPLDAIDEEMMKEAGLSPNDKADVQRFKYFFHSFDFRWLLTDRPSPGNWFGKTDLSVYLFDVVDTATMPDVPVAVFDVSAMREARLSGDRSRIASTLRATVDAMKADRRPKAVVAFSPDRNPESSMERAFVNLFARNVYFATTGSVTLSNLRDVAGAPVTSVVYPLRNVQALDVSASGEIAGTPFNANGSCLELQISDSSR